MKNLLLVLAIVGTLQTTVFGLEEVVEDGIHYVICPDEFPDRVMNFSGVKPELAEERPFIPAEKFVPVGLYGGGYGELVNKFLLADAARHYSNTYYINGSLPYRTDKTAANLEGAIRFVKEADSWGLRTYYQNQSASIRWPSRISMTGDRAKIYEKAKAWLESAIPEFVNDPVLRRGLLVWGPVEEIDLETAQDPLLAKLMKETFGKLDTYHPAAILLRAISYDAQEAMYKSMGNMPIIISDPYHNWRPFSWNEMISWERRTLKRWTDLAYANNSKFWLCGPCFSEGIRIEQEGEYKYHGYKMSNPQTMRVGYWMGLANGATGFFSYAHYLYHGNARSALTRLDCQPTEEYVAISRFFRKVSHLSPIIAEWKRVDLNTKLPVMQGKFKHPDYDGEFIVLVNCDLAKDISHTLPQKCIELEGFQQIGNSIKIPSGSGEVLFCGSEIEAKKLKHQLGFGAYPLKKVQILSDAALWSVSESKKSFAEVSRLKNISSASINIGGKGGVPTFYIAKMPTREKAALYGKLGKIVEWGDGVRVPSAFYHPPYPGPKEKVLNLNWNLQDIKASFVERAYIKIALKEPLNGGRVAVYPIIENGIGFDNKTEYMPRWEMEISDYRSKELLIEITGIVRDWLEGSLDNKGVIIVYNNWPDGSGKMPIDSISKLNIVYKPTAEIANK